MNYKENLKGLLNVELVEIDDGEEYLQFNNPMIVIGDYLPAEEFMKIVFGGFNN